LKDILKFTGPTLFLLLIFLTLISCTQTEKAKNKTSDSFEIQEYETIVLPFEHPQTKQKFKIINAYKLYHTYIEKVKENPNSILLDLYKEEVIEPTYNDCFNNAEYLHMADSILNVAPERFTEIQVLTEKMDSRGTDKLIREALEKSSNLIPSETETTVCVFPSTNLNIAMVTVGAGKIIIL
jgi:hypothetical protein